MRNKTQHVVVTIASVMCALPAMAAVSAEEAAQLGNALTAIGAEKAANKDGTIPIYTGEGIRASANWDPKNPQTRPDPFSAEKPMLSITSKNVAQYVDKIDGMAGVFTKYPDFRMDIYPTHRTATLPKWVQDNTIKNATACKGVDNDLKLEGCYGGYPFPIPKNGTQVMWNHLTNFEAQSWSGGSESFIVANNGNVSKVSGNKVWQQSWYYDPNITTPLKPSTVFWAARVDTIAPARANGQKLVLIDPLDTLGIGRRAYQYIPGQRRVKLAPDLSYDTPLPTAGGAMTTDDAKVFLGALDRYDWKLLGKKEKYILYNTFKLTEHTSCTPETLLTKNFANPDCMRWEAHRVWAVEAKLKPGYRHIYPRRVFYWDEDSYAAGLSENYDAGNGLYRVTLGISWPFWSSEGAGTTGDSNFTYDLTTGSWGVNGVTASKGTGWYVDKPNSPLLYSPEVLAGEGVR